MEIVPEELQQELEKITGEELLPGQTGQDLHERLIAYISSLIVNDQHKLIYLLYRIDLSEQKIKHLLQTHTDAGVLIADLIIERQVQKLQLRKQFRQDDSQIPDEEKW
ncbi:hypothetical protein SAMN05421788_102103 [Filimonas lacunae]|uniref:Uncharacterized protein n=1 Tax=Filimonas lacunae TaxID=477680 RepID=A0A173MI25_9BACT|nr:hypothetical protein [Filimonas lacunae]BAV07273.1 hypothetical protein FLA_3296 [Filimonas lacunae]SIS92202.1 hypothetical protein SAMN05421788_102103 [Filimonas lacunae]